MKDLVADLKSELSGHFFDLVMALMHTQSQFDASELRRAMKVIIAVLCAYHYTVLHKQSYILGSWY
jgi:hypothetical protein